MSSQIDKTHMLSPVPEKVEGPWVFRAFPGGSVTLRVDDGGKLRCDIALVLDLGFQTYKRAVFVADIPALSQQFDPQHLVEYIENWLVNGDPNYLTVTTSAPCSRLANISRKELDFATFKVIGEQTLEQSLRCEGLLAEKVLGA